MRTLIQGGGPYIPSQTDTEYVPVWGIWDWLTAADPHNANQVIPCAGKFSHLYVWTRGGPGAGKSRTFNLYKNGAATSLSVVIDEVAQYAEDVTHEVSLTPGDIVCIEHVPAGTPTCFETLWCLIFTASSTGESIVLGCTRAGDQGALNSGATEWAPCGTGGARLGAVTNYFEQPIPTDGKLSALYVELTAAPDPGGSDGYTFTLEVNGVASALVVTITGDNTTGDAASDIDIAEGDLVQLKIAPSGTPSATPHGRWGLKWEPDVSGEGIVLGMTYDYPSDSTTEYVCPTTHDTVPWATSTPSRSQPVWASTVKKFYVRLEHGPGAGTSRIFTIRRRTQAGAEDDTTITLTISGTDTTGNDTTHEHEADDYDQLVIQHSPVSSPDATTAQGWGWVCELPQLAPGGFGRNPADVLVKNALI